MYSGTLYFNWVYFRIIVIMFLRMPSFQNKATEISKKANSCPGRAPWLKPLQSSVILFSQLLAVIIWKCVLLRPGQRKEYLGYNFKRSDEMLVVAEH